MSIFYRIARFSLKFNVSSNVICHVFLTNLICYHDKFFFLWLAFKYFLFFWVFFFFFPSFFLYENEFFSRWLIDWMTWGKKLKGDSFSFNIGFDFVVCTIDCCCLRLVSQKLRWIWLLSLENKETVQKKKGFSRPFSFAWRMRPRWVFLTSALVITLLHKR